MSYFSLDSLRCSVFALSIVKDDNPLVIRRIFILLDVEILLIFVPWTF